MEIIKFANDRGGLMPDLLSLLHSDFKDQVYSPQYMLRLPRAIYSISIYNVFDCFLSIIDEVEKLAQNKPWLKYDGYVWDVEILEKIQKLLYSLAEHVDDLESIIKCFISPSEKVLLRQSIIALNREINSYRKRLFKIVNYLKHSQGRLRTITLFDDQQYYLGYYIEGVDSELTIGPSPIIHKGANTAFSLSRELRYNLFWVYLISNRTCDIVKELLQKSYTPIKIKSDVVTKPLEIVDKVMLFPYMYYFDEVKKQNAYIVQENDAGKIRIILEYPSTKVHPTVIPHGLNIVGFTKTDGATRAYRFPYADYYRPTKR